MSRVVYRVTFEGNHPPTREDLREVLHAEFAWDDDITELTVDPMPQLRGIDGGPPRRETR